MNAKKIVLYSLCFALPVVAAATAFPIAVSAQNKADAPGVTLQADVTLDESARRTYLSVESVDLSGVSMSYGDTVFPADRLSADYDFSTYGTRVVTLTYEESEKVSYTASFSVEVLGIRHLSVMNEESVTVSDDGIIDDSGVSVWALLTADTDCFTHPYDTWKDTIILDRAFYDVSVEETAYADMYNVCYSAGDASTYFTIVSDLLPVADEGDIVHYHSVSGNAGETLEVRVLNAKKMTHDCGLPKVEAKGRYIYNNTLTGTEKYLFAYTYEDQGNYLYSDKVGAYVSEGMNAIRANDGRVDRAGEDSGWSGWNGRTSSEGWTSSITSISEGVGYANNPDLLWAKVGETTFVAFPSDYRRALLREEEAYANKPALERTLTFSNEDGDGATLTLYVTASTMGFDFLDGVKGGDVAGIYEYCDKNGQDAVYGFSYSASGWSSFFNSASVYHQGLTDSQDGDDMVVRVGGNTFRALPEPWHRAVLGSEDRSVLTDENTKTVGFRSVTDDNMELTLYVQNASNDFAEPCSGTANYYAGTYLLRNKTDDSVKRYPFAYTYYNGVSMHQSFDRKCPNNNSDSQEQNEFWGNRDVFKVIIDGNEYVSSAYEWQTKILGKMTKFAPYSKDFAMQTITFSPLEEGNTASLTLSVEANYSDDSKYEAYGNYLYTCDGVTSSFGFFYSRKWTEDVASGFRSVSVYKEGLTESLDSGRLIVEILGKKYAVEEKEWRAHILFEQISEGEE